MTTPNSPTNLEKNINPPVKRRGRPRKVATAEVSNEDLPVFKASTFWNRINKVGYNVTTAEDYEKSLRQMTSLDLQKESVRVGLKPNDRRDLMISRLVREFSKTVGADRPVKPPQHGPKAGKYSEQSLEYIRRIF